MDEDFDEEFDGIYSGITIEDLENGRQATTEEIIGLVRQLERYQELGFITSKQELWLYELRKLLGAG
jgi:hypothetical protein